ncbi:MAG: GatB/YqeY domain-containing protein [candidate division Zixibacteria bacterium]
MSLQKRIDEDVIKALKSGEKDTVTTLRGLNSDIKYYRIDNQIEELKDDDIIKVLSSAAKQRRDSIEKFQQGGRDDLVEKEKAELNLITTYLPEQLSPEEIKKLVVEVIEETEATGMSDMGKVMKTVMPKTKGRADGKAIKEIVSRLLYQA